MKGFDTFVMVDWSARSAPSPRKRTKDSIFIAVHRDGRTDVAYARTRARACAALDSIFSETLGQGRRALAGFDFPFGYPAGFAAHLTGTPSPFAVWEWLAARVEDAADNSNNRFAVADAMNRKFPGLGPFWGCPAARATDALPERGSLRHGHGMRERRRVETEMRSAQPVWKLFTTGSVGSQSLLGLPRLRALRDRFGNAMRVAPFEPPDAPLVLSEMFPSMLAPTIAALARPGEIKDQAQVRVMADAFAALDARMLDAMLRQGDPEEGWILGAGHEQRLIDALGVGPGPRG